MWSRPLVANAFSALALCRDEWHPLNSVNDSRKKEYHPWLDCLVHRKYTELANPRSAGHFSARLEHDGTGCYFPLGTDNATKAAARAADINHWLQTEGWNQTWKRYAVEFTLAVFWNNDPLLCTYTTLFTSPGKHPTDATWRKRSRAGLVRILVVEANDVFRHALVKWAHRLPGCTCVGAFANPVQAQGKLSRAFADLVLFNRSLQDLQTSPRLPASALNAETPAIFAFGVYESSDDIFISHTGVSNGYFLRRTHPAQILTPVIGAGIARAAPVEQVLLETRRYFQDLIAGPPGSRPSGEQASLTPREEEILLRLSKGYQDKQIADTLSISTWTVHNHIKNIFKKLGVHSRTQAVIKHLQK